MDLKSSSTIGNDGLQQPQNDMTQENENNTRATSKRTIINEIKGTNFKNHIIIKNTKFQLQLLENGNIKKLIANLKRHKFGKTTIARKPYLGTKQ